ncbi:MAG: TolC family protein [Acidobacteriota bacterium]
MMKPIFAALGAVAMVVATSACPAQTPEAPAQDPMAALVEMALTHNPAIAAQRQKVAAALDRLPQAKALPDPTADVELMMLSVNHFNAGDALSKGVSIGLTQELPYPGKRKLREEKARRQVAVAQADLRAMESELRGEVKAAAYGYALNLRLLELNDQTTDALKAAAKGAMALYASGGGTQTDVLLAQTAVTQAHKERLDLVEEREIAAARLTDLLGGSLDRSLLRRIDIPKPAEEPSLDGLLNELDAEAPRIAAARAREQVEERRVAIARQDFKPDFIVGGRYRHNDVTMGGGDYLTAMVGITLPFFHRKDRYLPALDEALADQEGAKQETAGVMNQVRYDLTQAWQTASRDRAVFELFQNGLLIQAKQAYESSLASYGVGKTDFTTLLNTLAGYYGDQRQTLMAQADFQVALARIEAILGAPSSRAAFREGAGRPTVTPQEKKEHGE